MFTARDMARRRAARSSRQYLPPSSSNNTSQPPTGFLGMSLGGLGRSTTKRGGMLGFLRLEGGGSEDGERDGKRDSEVSVKLGFVLIRHATHAPCCAYPATRSLSADTLNPFLYHLTHPPPTHSTTHTPLPRTTPPPPLTTIPLPPQHAPPNHPSNVNQLLYVPLPSLAPPNNHIPIHSLINLQVTKLRASPRPLGTIP